MTTDTSEQRKPRRQALGKGLGALIPTASSKTDEAPASAGEAQSEFRVPSGYISAPLSRIRRAPAQPRKSFDQAALTELAESIKQSGLIQPLVVRERDGDFELIAGERRWRACQLAGLSEVPVVVRELTDAAAFAMALVENIQREDLNPLEEAMAYQRLLDDYGHTQKSVSEAVGKSRSAVANSVRLLNLPAGVQAYVFSGELSAGHARSLAALPPEEAEELAELMVKHGYSVREAEELVRESKATAAEPKPARTSRFRDDAQVRKVADELQQMLGTRVKVKDRHGKGHIEIHYADYDVLQDVLDRLLT